MSALLELYLNQFFVFVLVLARVAALVMSAPVFGSRSTPMQIRALLAVALAMLISPLQWGTDIEYPGNVMNFLVFIGCEAAVGLTIGLGITILFSGVQLAGTIIGQMSGARLAEIFDPSSNTNVAVYGQLMDMIALSVFLIIGGHRLVMQALLDTFTWLPVGKAAVSAGIVELTTELVSQSFILAVRGVAPVMIALLLSMIIMGLISRTLPQLNILVVGFSVNALVALAMLALSIGMLVWAFQEQVEPTLDLIRQTLRTAAVEP